MSLVQTHTALRASRIDQLSWEAGKEKSPLHLQYTLGRILCVELLAYLVSGTYFRLYTGRSENPPHSTLKSLSGHRP